MSAPLNHDLSQILTPAQAAIAIVQPDGLVAVSRGEGVTFRDLDDGVMLAGITRIKNGESWTQVVSEIASANEWLEKIIFSNSRSLFLELFDLSQVKQALDLGSGWGQLTRALASRVERVVSLEPDPRRLAMSAAIGKAEGLENVVPISGNIFEINFLPGIFDFVLLTGVLEWLGAGRAESIRESQIAALKRIRELLTPEGRVVVAIENRLGLKYLLGEIDDHTGLRDFAFLSSAEATDRYRQQLDAPLAAKTYSLGEYFELFRDGGLEVRQIYLAFPDYKLPELLVRSDDRAGIEYAASKLLFPDEHCGGNLPTTVDQHRLRSIYRSLPTPELLAELAPSFIIEAGRL